MTAVVYALVDSAGRAIYVGATRNIRRRIREHMATKPWWALVRGVEQYPQADWELALHVERNMIRALAPEFNVQSVDPLERFLSGSFGPLARTMFGSES